MAEHRHWVSEMRVKLSTAVAGFVILALVFQTAIQLARSGRWAQSARFKAVAHEAAAFGCRLAARTYAELEGDCVGQQSDIERMQVRYYHEVVGVAEKSAQYHDRLARKYSWIARYPWLPATPDPPPPKKPEVPAVLRKVGVGSPSF
jgi:hypothetical protein